MPESTHDAPDDLLDVEAAAAILEVAPAQVLAMVEQGLITPVGDEASGPRFRRAELLAARLLGG
jgi:hypothetical protein